MLNIIQNIIGKGEPERFSELDKLGNFPLHFHIKDSKGKYISCNKRLLRDTGYKKRNDFLGQNDLDLSITRPNILTEKEALTITEHDNLVRETQEAQFFLEHFAIFSGKRVIGFNHKSPILSRSKKIIGSLTIGLVIEENHILQLQSFTKSHLNKYNNLSKRQLDCLYYLVKGSTNKQIAKTLNLSPRTVEHYLDTVKTKLNCPTTSSLISKVLDQAI